MDEKKARKVLGDIIKDDNSLDYGIRYISWSVGDKEANLDDAFTADQLEAIVWWMRNSGALAAKR